MRKVNLTGTLRTYKAIVISGQARLPDGYVAIAGAVVKGHDVQIAIPQELVKDRELFKRLARQAQRCVLSLFEID